MKTKILLAITAVLALGLLGMKLHQGYILTPPKYDGVVRLVSPEGDTFCTGFVVAKDLVMTAGHCAFMEEMSIVDKDLKFSTKGKFKFVNPMSMQSEDVATISGDFSAFEILEMDMRHDVKVGAKVIAVGYALGGVAHTSSGIVTGFDKFFVQTKDLNLIQGMSGGPLFDTDSGKIVGINSRVDEGNVQLFTPMINLDAFTGL